ncbi:MAG: hypothetical protein M3Q31_12600 [Actinomycetota bacterium]|nr:hypothetical protein [Actinomycetota bacterium]
MNQDERMRVLEDENQRLERAATNRWSGFADADLRALTACLQVAADHVGDVIAAEAERFVREIGGETTRRSTA